MRKKNTADAADQHDRPADSRVGVLTASDPHILGQCPRLGQQRTRGKVKRIRQQDFEKVSAL